MSENQPFASTGKQSSEHRLTPSEPSHDRFADKLTWIVKRSGKVLLTVARSLFYELRTTSIATSQQIRRVAMLAIAEARIWQLRRKEQEAKVQCGKQLFHHSLGAPSILEQIRQLNARIDSEQTTSLDRWRLSYARDQLYSQLSACSSTEVPAALTEVYDVVENARTHAASLRSSLFPKTWTESIRVVTGISGIVLILLATTGFLRSDKPAKGTIPTIASTASGVDKKMPSPNEGNPRQSNARSSTPSTLDTQEARDAAAIDEIEAKPHWNDGPGFTLDDNRDRLRAGPTARVQSLTERPKIVVHRDNDIEMVSTQKMFVGDGYYLTLTAFFEAAEDRNLRRVLRGTMMLESVHEDRLKPHMVLSMSANGRNFRYIGDDALSHDGPDSRHYLTYSAIDPSELFFRDLKSLKTLEVKVNDGRWWEINKTSVQHIREFQTEVNAASFRK